MSKRKKNYPPPDEILDLYGAAPRSQGAGRPAVPRPKDPRPPHTATCRPRRQAARVLRAAPLGASGRERGRSGQLDAGRNCSVACALAACATAADPTLPLATAQAPTRCGCT